MQNICPGFALPSWIDSIDVELVTRNKDAVDNMKTDKLRWHGGTKAGTGWMLIQGCETAQNNLSTLTIPLLVLQGEMDKLVVPEGAQMIIDNASSVDKEYVLYPKAFHQLLIELADVKSNVQKRTLEWLNLRLNKD